MKKILFFGIYYPDYPRNKVLIEGFEKNGYKIDHCRVDPRIKKGISKYRELWKMARSLDLRNYDFIWVAFPGHTCMWLAKIIFHTQPIFFDVFLSLFEANVKDRKIYNSYSLKGIRDKFLDWYSIRLADMVILDTNAHIKAFHQKYFLNYKKAKRIFLSSTLPAKVNPRYEKKENFIVHFHGSFIPLHGVEYIIQAAKLIEEYKNIKIKMVGGGQKFNEMKALATSLQVENVEFLGRLEDYNDVLSYLDKGDIMLGMFAASGRGHWVIPNKIFEGMAFGKPIITAETEGIKELLVDRENVLFVKAGDSKDLAQKIIELYSNDNLREKIGRHALKTYKEDLLPKKLIEHFLDSLNLPK
jgi:glycosyltransferase involved in cell wall biosynthesis